MQETIRVLMGDYGNLAVFFLIMIENLFPPIPSEVILTFGGFMTTCSEMTAPGVILSATAGSLMGAVLLYLVGYLIPEEKLKELLEGRIGKLLHFRAEDVDKAREWFLKRGSGAVFFCRLIPVVRSLISIPAGLSRMPLVPFLFLTTVGSFLWNTVLVMAGRAAGNSWEKVSEALGVYSDVILMVGGGAVALLMAVHLFRNSKAN